VCVRVSSLFAVYFLSVVLSFVISVMAVDCLEIDF